MNVGVQILGLSEVFEGPMAVTGAFVDVFDYCSNNCPGTNTQPWKGAPIFGSGDGSGGAPPPAGAYPTGGGCPLRMGAKSQETVEMLSSVLTTVRSFHVGKKEGLVYV
jgi:hypothetical protein